MQVSTAEDGYPKAAIPAESLFCAPAFLFGFFFNNLCFCFFVSPGAQNVIVKSLYIPMGMAAVFQSDVLLLRDDLLKSSCLKVPLFCLNSVSDPGTVIFQIKPGLLGE